MRIFFDTLHLYYLPQYEPVYQALLGNADMTFVLYKQGEMQQVMQQYVNKLGLPHVWVESVEQAAEFYIQQRPDWVIFGKVFEYLDKVSQIANTALMEHGIGPKACYYEDSAASFSVRFVEGPHRLKRLQELYPDKTFIDTGYAKLDPIINGSIEALDLAQLGLDPQKKTLLYAPTFYPSSIQCLGKNFPQQVADYNLVIKPHFFSLVKSRYKAHRKLFNHWRQYKNVYLAPIEDANILPYMAVSDLMISDASSTLFEFTALNKPAIWCDFYHLRWTYRGPLKFRFKKRLDDDIQLFGKVAARADSPKQLLQHIETHVHQPALLEDARKKYLEPIAGLVDGQVSQRISQYLLAH